MARMATRFGWLFGIVLLGCWPAPRSGADTVVLVHGLGRSPASMAVLQNRLKGAGFRVVSFGYPSTSEEMEVLVDSLATAVDNCCADSPGTGASVRSALG